MNVFALVAYIPNPLGAFLDELRRELVPGCNPHAHVSVLPPRPLAVEWREASEQLRELAGAWAPFEVELRGVKRFPVTNVIYVELGAGAEEMHSLHEALSQDGLAFEEPFVYHPHVTLAQEVPASDVEDVDATARRRWDAYAGPRTFVVDRAVFVQNTMDNRWIDLAEYPLGAVALR